MKTIEFVQLLSEMARIERDNGQVELAFALDEFRKLFDETEYPKLDKVLEQIRNSRKLVAA